MKNRITPQCLKFAEHLRDTKRPGPLDEGSLVRDLTAEELETWSISFQEWQCAVDAVESARKTGQPLIKCLRRSAGLGPLDHIPSHPYDRDKILKRSGHH
jgi:hypothetical protein